MTTVLTARALSRATLARQLLLERADLPVVPAVERLFGLNAQEPDLPYLALWSRLHGFAIADLTAAVEEGTLVRSTLVRATQRIVSAADFRLVRPLLVPLLRRVQRNAFGRRTAGVDLDELVEEAAALLADGRVLTRPELGRRLARRWPHVEPTALGWSAQYLLPLVHPAPSGTWRTRGATPFALVDLPAAEHPEQLVLRYLAAFGPATVADARSWSGISGLREVVDRLRPRLRTFVDESGRELFDLPDAPTPPADQPAPVRFLPAFDEPLLAHADRTRIMTDEVRRRVCVGAGVAATVLVDGTVAATWTISRAEAGPVLAVRPLRPIAPADRADVEREGQRLLAFTDPGADGRVRVLRDGDAER